METAEPTPDNDDSQSAVAQFIQSDEAAETPPPPSELTATPLIFDQIVQVQLNARHVKPRCMECGCIGWANFHIHPAPVGSQQLFSNQVIPEASVICIKCGSTKRYNLEALGLAIKQPEPSRLVVP
jgi:RNase P subunit RPR2